MEFFYLIVLQYPEERGYSIVHRTGVFTSRPGGTRRTAFSVIEDSAITANRANHGDTMPNVVHFSLEPNQLVPED